MEMPSMNVGRADVCQYRLLENPSFTELQLRILMFAQASSVDEEGNETDRLVFITDKRLAERYGTSRDRVARARKELMDLGVITLEKYANNYPYAIHINWSVMKKLYRTEGMH